MLTKQMRPVVVFCIILVFGVFTFAGHLSPAHASVSRDVAYSLTLTINGPTTIKYNTTTQSMNASFYYPTIRPSIGENIKLFIDNVFTDSNSPNPFTSTEDQVYFGGVSGLSVGSHQLQAKYFVTTTSTLIVSNIITITVVKGDINDLICNVTNLTYTYTYALGQDMTIVFNLDPANSLQDSSGSVEFKGPTTVTFTNLKLNSNAEVTVKAPSTPGLYKIVCSYDGSPQYNSFTGTSFGVIVSTQHQTGQMRLYTNPTTITSQQSILWYLVIPAGSGLPTPTGSFDIVINNSSTTPIQLSANGDATIQTTTPPSVYGNIYILYFGDSVYASESVSFPLTNPAIPGGGGGGTNPTATPAPANTATAGSPVATSITGTATPTDTNVTPMPTSTLTAVTPPVLLGTPAIGISNGTSPKGYSGPGAPPIIVSVLVILVGVGGVLIWRRRIGATLPIETDHIWRQEPPMDDTSTNPKQPIE